jgi:hypothetical protein
MSGGSPSNVTQTQVTQLPSWLTNANTFGAGQAQNLYNTGGPAYYPGQQVAPFSSMQEQALSGAQNLATQGSPLTSAAQQQDTNIVNGQYMNPATNPYLQQTFNYAANAVQNKLGSEFAGSGRNPEASVAAQSDQMNQLANQIYGGNYQFGAQQQAQAISQANPLANQNWTNLAQLDSYGQQVQGQAQNMIGANTNLYNYNAQLPWTNLNNYMNQVNSLAHGGTQSNTQPYFQNQTGNALGGAAAGAAAGSAFGPWGTAIGGGLGLLSGYFG